MGFDHRRTVTHRLGQAAHAYRVRAGAGLARIGLHSGQESLLKALAGDDGMTMSDLAATLGVQPPTVTKMIGRLAAQDYVERRASKGDGSRLRSTLPSAGVGRLRRSTRSGSGSRRPPSTGSTTRIASASGSCCARSSATSAASAPNGPPVPTRTRPTLRSSPQPDGPRLRRLAGLPPPSVPGDQS
jgi:DNA-binding MarR family transcriptional regulator